MPPQLGLPATDVYQCHVDRFRGMRGHPRYGLLCSPLQTSHDILIHERGMRLSLRIGEIPGARAFTLYQTTTCEDPQQTNGYSAENSEALFIRGGDCQFMSYCWRTWQSRKLSLAHSFFKRIRPWRCLAERLAWEAGNRFANGNRTIDESLEKMLSATLKRRYMSLILPSQ
jgi:hypothetical protein